MQQGIPAGGSLAVGRGMPLGAGIVDYIASSPEQRIWYILRHEKAFTTALTGGSVDFFDTATSSPQDGNVERQNTIAEPQIFFVFGLTFRVEARVTVADLELLLDSLYLSFLVNQRLELGPINVAHTPCGGGPFGNSTATTVNIVTNGMPSGQLVNWFPIPLVIKGGEFFRAKVDVMVTLAALAATRRCELGQHGILFRRAVSQ
jgi:hypothetical protein